MHPLRFSGRGVDRQPADELRAGGFIGGAHAARGQHQWQVFVDASRGAGGRARSRRLDQPRSRRRTGAERAHHQEIFVADSRQDWNLERRGAGS